MTYVMSNSLHNIPQHCSRVSPHKWNHFGSGALAWWLHLYEASSHTWHLTYLDKHCRAVVLKTEQMVLEIL